MIVYRGESRKTRLLLFFYDKQIDLTKQYLFLIENQLASKLKSNCKYDG